jgi:exonuclease III
MGVGITISLNLVQINISEKLSATSLFNLVLYCYLLGAYGHHQPTWCPQRACSTWSVLSFNVRGINVVAKGNGIHCVIRESNSDIICLQETKRESFVRADLRRFCPSYFDEFAFVPSIGNSGGFITVWNSSKLVGNVVFQNEYALSVEFFATSSEESWIITNVYAPCSPAGKIDFLHWFSNINMPSDKRWLIVGDFNLTRRPENRNSAGGTLI